ncbi:hypothetical protein [Desulfatirhabdium butyrativorans]|uniref:hypothetical protein n=1 Tax=Desulfatirhabdium butyrativorans TaxID=340467 RepID=UPI00042343B9|nr:hypothetical protein [Desulfatirhabdium butyrativorans]
MRTNRYGKIIESIFLKYYQAGATEVSFERSDIIDSARELDINLPKNLGDVLYSFRYRADLPETIREKAPEGSVWIIRSVGRSHYKFVLTVQAKIIPSGMLVRTKILDATPGVIEKYALNDEQALLAKIRYNRLIDIFTGLTCYSLQNHLRTAVKGIGQIEIDELYVGIDKRGVLYILPIQAKGKADQIGVVQIEQDFAACAAKFPELPCRSIAAQFMDHRTIALLELEQTDQGILLTSEKHYSLVNPGDLSAEELKVYGQRAI